jgi:hypothetical protein
MTPPAKQIKVERWDKTQKTWIRVAYYPPNQVEAAVAYAENRTEATGIKYRAVRD